MTISMDPRVETTARDMVSAALKNEFPDAEDVTVSTCWNLAAKSLAIKVRMRFYASGQAAEQKIAVEDHIQAIDLHRAPPVATITKLLLRIIDQVYQTTGRKPPHESKGTRQANPEPGQTNSGISRT